MRPHPRYSPLPSPAAGAQALHSQWHSPVPYLFGGLAAMLGLIALALLILAFSYWKLSGFLDSGEGGSNSYDQSSDGKPAGDAKPSVEQFLVIMAGDEKPTFLATPIARCAASDDTVGNSENCNEDDGRKLELLQISEAGDEGSTQLDPDSTRSHHQNEQQ